MITSSHAASPAAPSRARSEESAVHSTCTSSDRKLLYSQLVLNLRSFLYGYLRRLGADPTFAEDCLQDALVRAYDRLVRAAAPAAADESRPEIPDLSDSSRAKAYLYGVTRHVYLDASRRRAVRSRPLPAEEEPTADDPEQDAGRRERIDMLRAAASGLEPPRPEILDLYYGADLSVAEIAEVIGIPVGTVKTHLHRSRAELRRLLEASPKEESE
ncbi:MAG: sigma-70 family RNA polymerase sigma factor [Polyangia bacterium]